MSIFEVDVFQCDLVLLYAYTIVDIENSGFAHCINAMSVAVDGYVLIDENSASEFKVIIVLVVIV